MQHYVAYTWYILIGTTVTVVTGLIAGLFFRRTTYPDKY
jgi:hypothetical protein